MIGILEEKDLELIDELLEDWWRQYEFQSEERELEIIQSLWSFLKDINKVENSFDKKDFKNFIQMWGSKFNDLEEWFLSIFEYNLQMEDPQLRKLLDYIWENNRNKKKIH